MRFFKKTGIQQNSLTKVRKHLLPVEV
jgi:hypothetical protein